MNRHASLLLKERAIDCEERERERARGTWDRENGIRKEMPLWSCRAGILDEGQGETYELSVTVSAGWRKGKLSGFHLWSSYIHFFRPCIPLEERVFNAFPSFRMAPPSSKPLDLPQVSYSILPLDQHEPPNLSQQPQFVQFGYNDGKEWSGYQECKDSQLQGRGGRYMRWIRQSLSLSLFLSLTLFIGSTDQGLTLLVK